MKLLIIDAGQNFGHSGGNLNHTITEWTVDFFRQMPDSEIKITHINEAYTLTEEVEKIVWADVIVYHTPIWWFSIPFGFKKYLDEVLTAGSGKGIYVSDGRTRQGNPKLNYGTGGSMQGKKYMLTTTWNAPEEAFTLPGEFFGQRSVDDGVMFGFHRMNAFIGMKPVLSFHFHDVMKDINEGSIEVFKNKYLAHLQKQFNV